MLCASSSGLHLSPGDLDPLDNLNEQDFEEVFHVLPAADLGEERLREEVLEENEALVKDNNAAFEAGQQTWFDAVNEFSNLPADEFELAKTGALDPAGSRGGHGRGLLDPLPENLVDEASEHHFDQFRYNRDDPPASYSSVDLGLVTPVRNQRDCGSCTAFASMAALETCFRIQNGVLGDYSEQEFVDCAYGINGANGCNGAPAEAYLKWVTDNPRDLAHESQYPYLNLAPKLTCSDPMPVYRQGAKVNASFYSYDADENLLKQLVYTYGAAVTTVKSEGPFELYKGGVFAGCNPGDDIDHAVAVVGYGNADGIDYWLIKNSWGPTWGEGGFIRLQRGVGMCGIGNMAAVISCTVDPGPTDEPLETAAPCEDMSSNCVDLAATYCYEPNIASACGKSCGLCPGMTPAESYTCYDLYPHCNTLCDTSFKPDCKLSCGLC